jgi:hypothetical protein
MNYHDFFLFCYEGDLDSLVKLHEKENFTIDFVQLYNQKTLHTALMQQHLDIGKWLFVTFHLEKNLKYFDVYPVLLKACEKGNLELCVWLYKTFQLNKDIFDRSDNYFINMVIFYGHLPICEWFQSVYPQSKDNIIFRKSYYNKKYYNSIETACKYGHLEIIKWLFLTFQLTINDISLNNNECFVLACKEGHYNVVEWLGLHFDIDKEIVLNPRTFIVEELSLLERFDIIQFLFNFFGVTEMDVEKIIYGIHLSKREKLIDCITLYGSSVKPVEMQ